MLEEEIDCSIVKNVIIVMRNFRREIVTYYRKVIVLIEVVNFTRTVIVEGNLGQIDVHKI